MAKSKKVRISNNVVEKSVNAQNEATNVSWGGIDFVVKKTVPLEDEIAIIVSSVENVFLEDETYMPEAAEMTMCVLIVEKYTNVEMPEDIQKQYDLIFRTDFMNHVLENIDKSQVDRIVSAIDERVHHRRDCLVTGVEQRVQDAINSFEGSMSRLTDLFSGISHEDISMLTKSLGSLGSIDEEKLIRAYMEVTKSE